MPTVRPKESNVTEQFFGQVSESVQLVFDLTSRIDERVKMLIERQKEIDDQLDKLLAMQNMALQRLATLESIVESRDFDTHLRSLSEKVAVISSSDLKDDVESLQNKNQELHNIIHTMQIKIETMWLRLGVNDSRWYTIFDGFYKLALMMIAGYILYKLGWQSPPNP